MSAILELEDLTVQFGGLTAVNRASCAVREKEIFSIIGPNGAGKTTVFNAITGIHEPTSGRVRFAGRELMRPFTPRVLIGCLLVGMFTALAAGLMSLNVDSLWRATIQRNFIDPAQGFSYAAAWRDAVAYVNGELAIERPRANRWEIVTADGTRALGNAPSEEQARALRDQFLQLIAFDGSTATLHERGGKWDINPAAASGADDQPLASYDSRDAAESALQKFAAIGREAANRRHLAELALVVGAAVGAAGAYVVWNRSRRTPDVIARAGIARTFQNIRLFANMTVLENVLTGMDRSLGAGVFHMALQTPRLARDEAAGKGRAMELLSFVGLTDQAEALAKNMPYGDQRRLEIARALATGPRLILLDEPAAGMNPTESADLTELIKKIRQRGITVLLIEHHMKVVMGISNRVAVLDYGCKIAEGTPEEVRKNPAVIAAYLGSEEVH